MNKERVRIYDLSRELDLDNKDILFICDRLNISVKSHSSTITESDADRIRAEAEKPSVRNEIKNKEDPQKNQKTPKLGDNNQLPPKKQQIVGIVQHHTPNYQPEESAINTTLQDPNQFSSMNQKTLNRPTSSSNFAQNQTDMASLDQDNTSEKANKDLSLTPPPPRPDKHKNASNVEKPVLKPKTDSESNKPKPISVPKSAGVSKENQREPIKIKKNLPSNETKVSPSKEEKHEPVSKPVKQSAASPPVKKTDQPRNRPFKPDQKASGGVKAIPPNKLGSKLPSATDADEDDDIVLEEPSVPFAPPELKPPNRAPSTNKSKKGKSSWEREEEEQENLSKVNAAKAKGKRSKQIILEEDEEDLEIDLDDLPASLAVSRSIARPPKAKSTTTPTLTPTQAPKRKPSTPVSTPQVEKQKKEEAIQKPTSIVLKGSLTLQELANLLVTPETEIIKTLFMKGIAVNITQTLDEETAKMVATELGVSVETKSEEQPAVKITQMLDEQDLDKLQLRPPVVTIMGHVDHGKTTLLDAIRATKVAQGEAGGITQHIGAYHVDIEHKGQPAQIVFLDTPGHEAFTAMRARGARVTDIAILVVAADDGVRPQTLEALSHAKAAKVPIVVAINKIDKADAQPDRVKQELVGYGLTPEEWGGDTIMVPVSALKGENLDTLLEMLLLVAEVEELQANPDRPAKGTVIEAHLDKSRGPVASLIVQNGTLKVGDMIVVGSCFGKVRAMINDRGQRVEQAGPSWPVEVLGLSSVPAAGEEFEVYPNEKEARQVAEDRSLSQRQSRLAIAMSSRRVTLGSLSEKAAEGDLKELNLILKADVQGSVEAILSSLEQLPQNEVQIRVLLGSPGEITETDVDLAAASGAVIIGFNTTYASGARQAAEETGVDVRDYNIIYKLLDDIQAVMEGLLDPEMVEEHLGQAEVRQVFAVGKGAIAGCYVLSGKMMRNSKIRVKRGKSIVYEGVLDSLKRMKDDQKEVNAGYECGIRADHFSVWELGDIIESYQMVSKRRTLSAK